MTASADVVVGEIDDCTCIPLSAVGVIQQRTYAKLVGSDQPVEITLGVRTDSRAQVLSGLSEGDEVELGWLRDPSAVLVTLAGRNPMPEEVINSIIAQGDEYGKARVVGATSGTGDTDQRSDGRRGSRSGERGLEMMDLSQLSPEMRARIEQMRETAGAGDQAQQVEEGVRAVVGRRAGAQSDSARTARIMQALRGMRDDMPEDLKTEIDAIIESGEFNFRSVSPALMDSMRARGAMGRGRRPPPEQPPPARF
jgi:hypothetical protein